MTTRTRRSGHESHHSANGGMIGFRTVDSLIREPALMARGDSERDGNGVTTTKWQLTDTGLSSLATGRRA